MMRREVCTGFQDGEKNLWCMGLSAREWQMLERRKGSGAALDDARDRIPGTVKMVAAPIERSRQIFPDRALPGSFRDVRLLRCGSAVFRNERLVFRQDARCFGLESLDPGELPTFKPGFGIEAGIKKKAGSRPRVGSSS